MYVAVQHRIKDPEQFSRSGHPQPDRLAASDRPVVPGPAVAAG